MVAVLTGIGLITAATGTAQAAPATGSGSTQNVIVVLHDQHSDLAIAKGSRTSARVTANRRDQSAQLARAHGVGARNLHGFDTVNAYAATVTPTQAAALAADPAVAAVYPDLPITKPVSERTQPSSASGGPTSAAPRSGICPTDPTKPLLEPEALQVTKAAFTDPTIPQAQQLFTGVGVKVAFIADGLDINNPDFIRANGQHVFIDYQDFSGDGPNAPTSGAEAFGDGSSIAAQGREVYDLSEYVNSTQPLPAGCTITVRGWPRGPA